MEEGRQFYEYAEEYYEKNKFNLVALIAYPERDQFDKFIGNLYLCSFLDEIPKSDWEENIILILNWAKKHYKAPTFKPMHNKQRAVKARDEHIKQLLATLSLLEEFIPKEISRYANNKGTVFVEYEGRPFSDITSIEKTYKYIKNMVDDLSNEEYKIFPKEYYRGSRKNSKEELEELLKNIAKKYNISPYSDGIRDLRGEI